MKIFSAEQIRHWDQFTIEYEPISSLALMERASNAFVDWWVTTFPDTDRAVIIFCGMGNNGGDGLAVARLLHQNFYTVKVFICRIGKVISADCAANYEALQAVKAVEISEIKEGDTWPGIAPTAILIDAIFGSGLNRPIKGYWGDLIQYLNQIKLPIIAIDIPSGLFADQPSIGENIIQAKYTLSFQSPKLAFLLPQNHKYVGNWVVRDIGLLPQFSRAEPTSFYLLTSETIKQWLISRHQFDHKGTFGHALLVVGSYGKMGAAVLAAKACLRSGVGLLSVHIPTCGYQIMQSQVPEAMVLTDEHASYLTGISQGENDKAIGIGCGIGQEAATQEALFKIIKTAQRPLLLDADALNILGKNPTWLNQLPPKSILTPHPKEFERLFGATVDDFQRLALLSQKAVEHQLIIVLKGAFTCIALPNGVCYFNTTGNPGMATGGSGDALTGIICGLLAQGYPPEQAALIGVHLHGLAGDLAASEWGEEALLPSDLIQHLGKAFTQLKMRK
ncbi:MAG: NAD(P)H-hydrate dehydratase [Saprospiraceae bacterium]